MGNGPIVGPEGDRVAERLTVSAKPCRLERVTIDVPENPGWIANRLGRLRRLKSGGLAAFQRLVSLILK